MSMSGKRLAVLIDLSGTLHIGGTAIPGAVEALARLRTLPGVRVKFVTNTTKESERFLYERLIELGFKIDRREIFTSLTAARRLIDNRQLRPMLFLEDVALEDFAGVPYSLPESYGEGEVAPDVSAVVIGLAPSRFDYPCINAAFRSILNKKAELIAIHKGRYLKKEDGQLALGPGPFVQALEYATDSKAIVVGKPERRFFEDALRSLGTDGDQQTWPEVVMIGDDVRDDVGGAQAAGMRGILVKTGKYRAGDERKISPMPWAVVDSFVDAVTKVEELLASNNVGN